MRKLFLAYLFAFMVFVVHANPISPDLLSEIWFEADPDTGDAMLMMEFCPEVFGGYPTWENIVFVCDGIEYQIPAGLDFPEQGTIMVINASQLMPGMALTPNSGTLQIFQRIGVHDYLLHNVPFSSVYPLLPGQSFVFARATSLYGETVVFLAKDSPPTPGTNAYNCVNLASLNLTCIGSGNGAPIEGINATYSSFLGTTDANGNLNVNIYPHYGYLTLWSVVDNVVQYHYSQVWAVEPGEEINQTLQLTTTNHDDALPISNAVIRAHPSPFVSGKHLDIKIIGNGFKPSECVVLVYNARGQRIQRIPFTDSGIASWKPSRHVSTGVYTLRLMQGSKELSQTRVSILK